MYPAKGTYDDFMNELNRLFPRTTENDVFQTQMQTTNAVYSPFQSTPANKSSSSADSMSPDTFPDMSFRPDIERQPIETPFVVRRQRPIVGRRIFENTECMQPITEPKFEPPSKPYKQEIDFPSSIWRFDKSDDQLLFGQTPPKTEQKKFTPNMFYEPFPAEKRGFEFKNPAAPISPVSNYTGSGASPKYSSSIPSTSPTSVNQLRLPTSPMRFPSQSNFSPNSRFHDARSTNSTKMCTFCRKNGETPLVYMTHMVKEKVGNRNVVTCPILRSHVCSTCGASGDNAHTITYCPVLRSTNNGQPLQSTTITLKNTRIKSNGRRRSRSSALRERPERRIGEDPTLKKGCGHTSQPPENWPSASRSLNSLMIYGCYGDITSQLGMSGCPSCPQRWIRA